MQHPLQHFSITVSVFVKRRAPHNRTTQQTYRPTLTSDDNKELLKTLISGKSEVITVPNDKVLSDNLENLLASTLKSRPEKLVLGTL